MQATFLDGRVIARVGDITEESVDAIVNAANSSLLGGGGVDGAIHAGGGPEIVAECRAIRRERYPEGLPAGQAVITTAGALPARFVVHTVGPVYGANHGRDDQLLASCYVSCLKIAAEHSLNTIAFPSISTGVYHFPKAKAAKIVSNVLTEFVATEEVPGEIRLVFFSPNDFEIFTENAQFR